MGKGDKPEECKRNGRRIREEVWIEKKKNRRKYWGDLQQNYYMDGTMESSIGNT